MEMSDDTAEKITAVSCGNTDEVNSSKNLNATGAVKSVR